MLWIPIIIVTIMLCLALGGAISLNFLIFFTDSGVNEDLGAYFAIATVVLLILWLILANMQTRKQDNNELDQAKKTDRIRAALILAKSVTGKTSGDAWHEVILSLMVDHENHAPFLAKATEYISVANSSNYDRGKLLTVAHPYPEFNTVHIVDGLPPKPYQELVLEDQSNALSLPDHPGDSHLFKPWARKLLAVLYIGAFLVGTIGLPLALQS